MRHTRRRSHTFRLVAANLERAWKIRWWLDPRASMVGDAFYCRGLPMPDSTNSAESFDLSTADERISPLHGYRGLPEQAAPLPRTLTIALSREAGSRGASIARRVGSRLGWEVYTQEMLEVLSQDPALRQDLQNQLPEGA